MEDLARTVMLDELSRNPVARAAFAATVYDMEALKKNLQTRLNEAEVDLRAKSVDLFQEYDRLCAEGEFRRGISLPALAILAGLGALLFELFSVRLTTAWLVTLFAAAAIIASVLHSAGSRKLKEANRLLYSCVKRTIASVSERKLFGLAMFVPTETTVLPRTSPVAYKVREFRNAVIIKAFGWAISRLRPPMQCVSCGEVIGRQRPNAPDAEAAVTGTTSGRP